MTRLILCLLGLSLVAAHAAESIVTLRVTVTNVPSAGATLTVNGDARTWASSVSTPPTQILISTNSGAASATNLYAHAAVYGFTGPLALGFSSSNVVTLRGQVNGAVVGSVSAGWASLSYVTNSVTNMFTVRVPAAAEPLNLRRYVADQIVQTLLDNALSNVFTDATPALSNHVNRGGSQTISGAKTWVGSNAFSSITTTGLVNRGSAISSAGPAANSEQFGTGASATNTGSLSVGAASRAWGDSAMAAGNTARADGDFSVALGNFSTADADDSVAVGPGAFVTGLRAIAVGSGAEAQGQDSVVQGWLAADSGHSNVVVLGALAFATAPMQVVLGTTGHTVKVPGKIDGPLVTNGTYHGTIGSLSGGTITGSTITGAVVHATGGTLAGVTTSGATHNGTIGTLSSGTITGTSLSSVSVSGAIMSGTTALGGVVTLGKNVVSSLANGANAGVNPGSYSYVRITAGPTAAFSIAGFQGGADGRVLYLHNATGQNMTLSHDSGVDPTAANRIKSNTGADLVSTGNATAMLIYDSSESRWVVMAWNP